MITLIVVILSISSCTGFLPPFTATRKTSLIRFNMMGGDISSSLDIAASSVNAWSVTGQGSAAINSADVASSFFAVSLFPYLALLWYLKRPETRTPPLANFGFTFLLAFVGATIPAGIYAKVAYSDILANVDWLHGGAESLLTITNLLIILGIRQVRERPESSSPVTAVQNALAEFPAILGVTAAVALFSTVLTGIPPTFHSEPTNALSIPTWIVHSSSLLEWLVAMQLIWEHADVSGNPRWKGLTWGMIPSHTSGICACVYHFFYNSTGVTWLVALQSFLTVLGNSTMAYAAFRIYQYEMEEDPSSLSVGEKQIVPALETSDTAFFTQLIVVSAATAFVVKYGELFVAAPFDESSMSLVAGILIAAPTLANVAKWWNRETTKYENSLINTLN